MAKDLLSFPDILSNMGGIEMLADTIRKTSGQSTDQDKNTFKAIVLRGTDGTQTNNAALGGALGSNDLTKSNRNRAGITRTYFVKILEDSPHAYLPDPCIQGSTQITETNNNHLIQGMYTYAIDQSGQPLNENDIILLRLEKRDFGYDTDIGYIVGVVGQKEAAKLKAEEEIGCASPSSAYNNKNLSVFDNQGQASNNKPAMLSENSAVPNKGASKLEELHPDFKALIGNLVYNMDARGFKTNVASGFRSPSEQAQKVAKGFSETSFGYHNFVDSTGAGASQAVDLIDAVAGYGPDDPKDDPERHEKAARYFKALGEEAKKLGLAWGGDFKKSNPLWAKHGMGWDPAHVMLKGSPGETLANAKKIFKDSVTVV
jgi:hypothetical protein